jgi:Family of unknown function (DUF5906)
MDTTGRSKDQAGTSPKIPAWLRHHVYVVSIKRFVNIQTGQLLDKEQFSDRIGPIAIKKDEFCDPTRLFFLGRRGQIADILTFRPGQPLLVRERGLSALNVYRPPRTPSMDGNTGTVAPWLELGEHVIPDPAARHHHLCYFAHLIQHPEEKVNHGLLLLSTEQGIGKDSWFLPIVRLLDHLATSIFRSDFENPFNDYLHEKLLVVVEELRDFGHELPNKLKPILASPPEYLRINRKNTPQFEIPNVVRGFLMSNFECPLKIEASDRRFHIYRSPALPKPSEFYDRYYRWLNHATTLGAVSRYLRHYDLTGFVAAARPPMTGAKSDLIAASEAPIDQHLRLILAWSPDLITMDFVLEELAKTFRRTTPQKSAGALKRLGAAQVGRPRIGEQRPHLWAVRNIEHWSSLDETALRTAFLALQLGAPRVPNPPESLTNHDPGPDMDRTKKGPVH